MERYLELIKYPVHSLGLKGSIKNKLMSTSVPQVVVPCKITSPVMVLYNRIHRIQDSIELQINNKFYEKFEEYNKEGIINIT